MGINNYQGNLNFLNGTLLFQRNVLVVKQALCNCFCISTSFRSTGIGKNQGNKMYKSMLNMLHLRSDKAKNVAQESKTMFDSRVKINTTLATKKLIS